MAERRGGKRRAAVGGLALAAWLAAAAPIAAQEQKPATDGQTAGKTAEAAGPNAGPLSLSAGVDWTSAYFKTANGGDWTQVIGTAGLAFSY